MVLQMESASLEAACKPNLHTGMTAARMMINHWYGSPVLCLDLVLTTSQNKRRKTKVVEDSDSDVPLARKGSKVLKKPPKITAAEIGEEDDSDVPIAQKLAKEKKQIEKKAEVTAKKIRAEEAKPPKKRVKVEDSDDDVPLSKAKKVAAKKTPNGTTSTPSSAKAKSKTQEKAIKKGKVKTESDDAAEEEEEEFRWWEAPDKNDTSIKWTTLEHNGVLFPPEYVPQPKHVKLIYDGTPVSLHKDAEEVASFYGGMLNSTVNVENPTFNKNFFNDFKIVLDRTGHGKDSSGNTVKVTSFEKCDFTKIFEQFEVDRARKKALPGDEKKRIKAEKDKMEEPFQYCKWDGRKEKVGNFRVEPPSLFRGRGEHPKTGRVKLRVAPEQITINIGKDAKVPAPPPGHKWKEVKHDGTGTWLAMWQENINGAYKYVMLAANSSVKGQSDFKKFEKARELKKHIDRIRKDYEQELKSKNTADRQRATAIYLIDKFALRAGNEKGDDEADTVGCCSLKFQHVTLRRDTVVVDGEEREKCIVIFDFLGKDSIRFYDEVEVVPQVFKNLMIFKKEPKGEDDDIFDRLTTSALNKHLTSYMPGLTAKVFRTYNASWTMSTLLKDLKLQGTVQEKFKAYNDANRKVAILCNHKRTVGASHEASMEKMQDKLNGMRYEQWRVRMMMLDLEPKLKKRKGADYFKRPEDLDDEWIQKFQASQISTKEEKIRKTFERENEKLKAEGKKPQSEKDLKEKLADVKELEKKFKTENKSGKVVAEGRGVTVEKLEAKYDGIGQRIQNHKIQAEDKEDNKEVALGTSKIVGLSISRYNL